MSNEDRLAAIDACTRHLKFNAPAVVHRYLAEYLEVINILTTNSSTEQIYQAIDQFNDKYDANVIKD